jgi:YVTN family beta-propeller protein
MSRTLPNMWNSYCAQVPYFFPFSPFYYPGPYVPYVSYYPCEYPQYFGDSPVNFKKLAPRLYVTGGQSSNVAVIDTTDNKVVTKFNVGGSVYYAAVTPDGKKVYVTGLGPNAVSVIDTTNYRVIKTITSMVGEPGDVKISPDGRKAYVVNVVSGRPQSNVLIINTLDDTNLGVITGFAYPKGLALSPDGTRAYITDINVDTRSVFVVNTKDNQIIATIKIGQRPYYPAVTPDGKWVYVPSDPGNVSVIDTSNNSITKTISLGQGTPEIVAITPDGTKAYVTNPSRSNVSVINTSDNSVIATISIEGHPSGIAMNPYATRAYVSAENSVFVIDTITNTVIQKIDTGMSGGRIAIG